MRITSCWARGQVRHRVFDFDAAQVDAALGEAQFQDLQHLLELEIHFRLEFDSELLQLEHRAGVLEVEALTELAVGLIDRVGDFMGLSSETVSKEGMVRGLGRAEAAIVPQ